MCIVCKSMTKDLLSNLTTFSGVAISLTEVNITTPNKWTSQAVLVRVNIVFAVVCRYVSRCFKEVEFSTGL